MLKTWNIKWHWLRNKTLLYQLRVYWDKGKNEDTDYFTENLSPIQHCQMQPNYIHTSNLVRKITQIIRLCKGVLNLVPITQSWI